MYQKITQKKSTDYCQMKEKELVFGLMNPKRETLKFILQFADAYYVEKQLPASLGGMILN